MIITILFGVLLLQAQENRVFYYNDGQKIYLDRIENTKIIQFKKTIDISQKDYICNQLRASDSYIIKKINLLMYQVSGNTAQLGKNSIVVTAKANGDIAYISDMLMSKDSTILWSYNKIFVKTYPTSDLQTVLQKNKIPFTDFKQFGSDKHIYLIELDVSESSAIEYANILSETGNVMWAQPSFWSSIRKHNPYYYGQWGFFNNGQYYNNVQVAPDANINVTDAWNIATGSGIKVAVIDDGVDLTHPDLKNNFLYDHNNLVIGYDATDAFYGGSNGGYGGNGTIENDGHGTACAGIIAAEDNNIGVKGVAYNAKIIPIRIFYTDTIYVWVPTYNEHTGLTEWVLTPFEATISNDEWITDAIYKAWHDYGADVLSNSWSVNYRGVINAEINAATIAGRDYLGCVVVFSSGNYYDYFNEGVRFPAYLPNVIAVGAISPCGERKSHFSCDGKPWGSNFSEELDIVAPGVFIPTTDLQDTHGYNKNPGLSGNIYDINMDGNYFGYFGGTSAAAPHVAGVAALILSANPNLTGQQVRNIIESTAQKISNPNNIYTSYTYENTPGRTNGTWNIEMGYGLVDAYAAVQLALCPSIITNQTFTTDRVFKSCCEIEISNTSIEPGANVTVTSGSRIRLLPGFHAKAGSSFHAKISQLPCEEIPTIYPPIYSPSFIRKQNIFDTPDENTDITSIEEIKTASTSEIEIFPNPANNKITIKSNIGEYIKRIEINNSLGISVLSANADGFFSSDIDISGLASGIYFVSVFTENNTIRTAKVIKK